jgi:hypothetical protein
VGGCQLYCAGVLGMTCCNNDCNQGRDCPARVANVGKSIPLPVYDYEPPRTLAYHLVPFVLLALIVAVVGVLMAVFIGLTT